MKKYDEKFNGEMKTKKFKRKNNTCSMKMNHSKVKPFHDTHWLQTAFGWRRIRHSISRPSIRLGGWWTFFLDFNYFVIFIVVVRVVFMNSGSILFRSCAVLVFHFCCSFATSCQKLVRKTGCPFTVSIMVAKTLFRREKYNARYDGVDEKYNVEFCKFRPREELEKLGRCHCSLNQILCTFRFRHFSVVVVCVYCCWWWWYFCCWWCYFCCWWCCCWWCCWLLPSYQYSKYLLAFLFLWHLNISFYLIFVSWLTLWYKISCIIKFEICWIVWSLRLDIRWPLPLKTQQY